MYICMRARKDVSRCHTLMAGRKNETGDEGLSLLTATLPELTLPYEVQYVDQKAT